MTPINTKAVTNRRSVHFGTLEDLLGDLDEVAKADAAGRVRPLGNWSPGQNLQHLAKFLACSLDGFGGDPPLGLKLFGRVLRLVMGKKIFIKPVPPGIKLPSDVPFLPADEVSVADGAADLRREIERVQSGAAFIPASPLFGKLSREQWIELHLRHAELHMSFVGIGNAPA
ncbi:DUF1569 domain-containing protein [bacterium AH-315-K20]|nr:DUF1569 domain-containing protein [bacterium AH-315-K20]